MILGSNHHFAVIEGTHPRKLLYEKDSNPQELGKGGKVSLALTPFH
jgi:hypothetical protein